MMHLKSFNKWIKPKLVSKSNLNISGITPEFDSLGVFYHRLGNKIPYFLKIHNSISRKKAEVSNYLLNLSILLLNMFWHKILISNVSPICYSKETIGLQKSDGLQDANSSLLFFSDEKSPPKQNDTNTTSNPELNKLDPIKAMMLLSIEIERENNLLTLKFFEQIWLLAFTFQREKYIALVKKTETVTFYITLVELLNNICKREEILRVSEESQKFILYDQQINQILQNGEKEVLKYLSVSEAEVSKSRTILLLRNKAGYLKGIENLKATLEMTIPPTKKLTKEEIFQVYGEIDEYLQQNRKLFQDIFKYMKLYKLQINPMKLITRYFLDEVKQKMDFEQEDFLISSLDDKTISESELKALQTNLDNSLSKIVKECFK